MPQSPEQLSKAIKRERRNNAAAIKAELERRWREGGCINPSHINLWYFESKYSRTVYSMRVKKGGLNFPKYRKRPRLYGRWPIMLPFERL